MTETTADILAIGEIVGTKVDAKRVAAGLRADMAATTVAPLFGTFPASAFAQNVGLVALTGIKSRYAVAMPADWSCCCSACCPWSAQSSPRSPSRCSAVRASCCSARWPQAASARSREVDYEDNLNMVIVAVAVAVGIIPIAAPDFWSVPRAGSATIIALRHQRGTRSSLSCSTCSSTRSASAGSRAPR